MSICADYFMHAPIHSENSNIVDKSLIILDELIKKASLINVIRYCCSMCGSIKFKK